jgi:hypothetical protein
VLGLKNYINTLSGAYKKQSLEFLSIVENSMADSSQVSAGGFNVVEAVAQIVFQTRIAYMRSKPKAIGKHMRSDGKQRPDKLLALMLDDLGRGESNLFGFSPTDFSGFLLPHQMPGAVFMDGKNPFPACFNETDFQKGRYIQALLMMKKYLIDCYMETRPESSDSTLLSRKASIKSLDCHEAPDISKRDDSEVIMLQTLEQFIEKYNQQLLHDGGEALGSITVLGNALGLIHNEINRVLECYDQAASTDNQQRVAALQYCIVTWQISMGLQPKESLQQGFSLPGLGQTTDASSPAGLALCELSSTAIAAYARAAVEREIEGLKRMADNLEGVASYCARSTVEGGGGGAGETRRCSPRLAAKERRGGGQHPSPGDVAEKDRRMLFGGGGGDGSTH